MALSSTTEWEVRTDGNDLNGGGFNPARSGATKTSTDNYTYGPSYAVYSGTSLTVDVTTNTYVQPDGYTPVTADIGHVIQISGGTGWTTGFYEIVGIIGSQWILDRSPAAAGTAGGVWRLGGALATPGKAGGAHVGGNVIWLKAGTYHHTSSTDNAAGGRIVLASGTSARMTRLIGYSATRGDTPPYGSQPILLATGTGALTRHVQTASYSAALNVTGDGATYTDGGGSAQFQVADLSFAHNCHARWNNGSPQGHGFSGPGACVRCSYVNAAASGNGSGFKTRFCVDCYSECGQTNFETHAAGGVRASVWVRCVSVNPNSSVGHFSAAGSGTGYCSALAIDCVASGAGTGYSRVSVATGILLVRCVARSCTTAASGCHALTPLLKYGGADGTLDSGVVSALSSDPCPGAPTDWTTVGLGSYATPFIGGMFGTTDMIPGITIETQASQTAKPLNLGGGFTL